MRVALVNPNFYGFSTVEPSLGLGYLAAIAKKNNCSIRVLDAHAENVKAKDAAKKILDCKPLIVGITSSTPQAYEALEIARNVKKADKSIKIIFGGSHPSVLPQEVLSSGVVDIVVRGEGNIIFDNLLKAIGSGNDLNKVKGISWTKNDQIIHNQDEELIEDLNKLDFPNWDDFNLKLYSPPTKKFNPYLPLMTTWGCPYSCIYCFQAQKKFRKRSAKNVVDEIEYLINHYHIKEIELIDDNFTLDLDHAFSVCDEIISRGVKIAWNLPGGIRVDAASRELLKRFKEAGCYALSFGVESGSQKVLDTIHKKIKLDQVRKVIATAKKERLRIIAFIIFGLPNETRDDMAETIRFVKNLNTDFAQFQIAMPYPGTQLYDILKKENRLLTEDWSLYDRYAGRAVFEMGATKTEIEAAFRKGIMSFYLRPKFIFKNVILSPLRTYKLMRFFLQGRKIKEYIVSFLKR